MKRFSFSPQETVIDYVFLDFVPANPADFTRSKSLSKSERVTCGSWLKFSVSKMGVHGSSPAGQGESLCAFLPRPVVVLLRTGGSFFPGTNERKDIQKISWKLSANMSPTTSDAERKGWCATGKKQFSKFWCILTLIINSLCCSRFLYSTIFELISQARLSSAELPTIML